MSCWSFEGILSIIFYLAILYKVKTNNCSDNDMTRLVIKAMKFFLVGQNISPVLLFKLCVFGNQESFLHINNVLISPSVAWVVGNNHIVLYSHAESMLRTYKGNLKTAGCRLMTI